MVGWPGYVSGGRRPLKPINGLYLVYTWYRPTSAIYVVIQWYIPGIYQVYTNVFLNLVYIPGIYQNRPQGIFMVYTWYIPGTRIPCHWGIYLVYTWNILYLCHFQFVWCG